MAGHGWKIVILFMMACFSNGHPSFAEPATFTDALQRIRQFLKESPKAENASGTDTGISTHAISIIEDDLPVTGRSSDASSATSLSSDPVAEPSEASSSSMPIDFPLSDEPGGKDQIAGFAETASAGWLPIEKLPEQIEPIESGGRLVTPQGEGILDVVVTTVREKSPRQISILPERVELWAQDRLLASLENGEAGVENTFHRRTFSFSPITMPAGYYFLTIRGFAEGFVTRERKWKGRIIQFGIHDGKTTKLREALPMFVW